MTSEPSDRAGATLANAEWGVLPVLALEQGVSVGVLDGSLGKGSRCTVETCLPSKLQVSTMTRETASDVRLVLLLGYSKFPVLR